MRHGITSKVFHSEAGAVQPDAVANWRYTLLKRILESYELKDIFNVDELGLFWKLMPNRTLAFKNEKCSGGKESKERLTVLLGKGRGNALRAIKSAWENVKSETIVHCFRHCGFVTNDTPEVEVADDEEPFESFFKHLRHSYPSVTSDVTSGDFHSVDDSLVTTEAPSLADIDSSTVSLSSAVAEEPDSDENGVDDITPMPSVPSPFGFLSSLQRIADASATSSDQANQLHHHISALQSTFADISASSARHSSTRDFFRPT
uniref:Uncharacterized protein n=1 Tax=Plectus sambesii TaxID=2011161 RepID=A0A914V9J0_9BILA